MKRIIKTIAILLLAIILVAAVVVTAVIKEAPPIDPEGLLTEVRAMPYYTPYEELPQHMIDATLAAEDHRYFRHHGIDWIRVVRAACYDLRHGALIQGASTIPMQLSKNHFTSYEKSFKRKLWDMHYAKILEEHLTKEEILECYLNTIGLSRGVVGVGEGARAFFGKTPEELTPAQSAMLVGITNWPVRYTPFQLSDATVDSEKLYITLEEAPERQEALWDVLFEKGQIDEEELEFLESGQGKVWTWEENPNCIKRQQYVIDRLQIIGKITKNEAEDMKAEPVNLAPKNIKIEGGHDGNLTCGTLFQDLWLSRQFNSCLEGY